MEEVDDPFFLTEDQLLEFGLTEREIDQLLAINWEDLPADFDITEVDFEEIDVADLPLDFDWEALDEDQFEEIDFFDYYTRDW